MTPLRVGRPGLSQPAVWRTEAREGGPPPPLLRAGRFPADHLVVSAVVHDARHAPPGWDRLRWVDEEGRPLIESHAPEELTSAAGTELRRCPYRGSRRHHDKPMNVSALVQVREHWERTLALYGGLRQLLHPHRSAEPLTVEELWRMSYLAFSVPPYLALSAREPVGVLPAWAAALFKTGLGLTPLTILVLEARLAGVEPPVVDGDTVVRVADESGTLIGDRHVCAGPARMITEVIDSVVQPPSGGPVTSLDTLLADAGAYRTFGLRLLDACVGSYLFFLSRQRLAALAGGPAEPAVDPNVFPYIDLLDDATDADVRDLLLVVGGLVEGDASLQSHAAALAAAWGSASDGTADRLAGAGSGDRDTARLLVTAARAERAYLALLGTAEARLREALGLEPCAVRLDDGLVDLLFPANPRAVLAARLGVTVRVTADEAAVVLAGGRDLVL